MRSYDFTSDNDNIDNCDRRVADVDIRLIIKLIITIRIY